VLFILEVLLPVSSLHYLAASLPGNIQLRWLCQVPCVMRPAVQLAYRRLLDSDVPTVPASLMHVMPWTVIAASTTPSELDALIQATEGPFLLLDVPVFHRQSFGNMSS
jgi:hypothetical protein